MIHLDKISMYMWQSYIYVYIYATADPPNLIFALQVLLLLVEKSRQTFCQEFFNHRNNRIKDCMSGHSVIIIGQNKPYLLFL